jgi:periplasmic protein TonB
VPDNINRGTLRQNIGTVFNISDLDRQPEALVQTPPLYPYALKREGATATVRVQFIVDSDGHVVNPVVIDSTHSGFNDAAMQGVSKWKFRAGMKGGRRVNTRMEVPILFKVTGEE